MVKITLSVPSQCGCVPGLLEEITSACIDETVFPSLQEDIWVGVIIGGAMLANPEVIEKLPKMDDGITPKVTPDTIKIGVFRG
jgi:hypothetical protein